MDDRIQQRVQLFVQQLLQEEKSSLRKARTLLEIEELTGEIGDEVTRQLASADLQERADEAAACPVALCPDCGRECEFEGDSEPLILQGECGDIEYSEPRSYCRNCRRHFFPSGSGNSATGS